MAEPFGATALAPALLAGDEDALRQLLDHALPRLMRIAVSAGANPADAEDVAMDAIFASLVQLPALNFSNSRSADPLFSYMAAAAENRVHEDQRRRLRERTALAKAVGGSRVDGRLFSLEAPVHPSVTTRHADRAGKSVWTSTSEDGSAESGRVRAMRLFLDGLNDDDRLLIELRAFSGDTWEEIAEQIGIEPAAARQRGSRLMKKAQKTLTTEEALNDQRA